VDIGNILPVFGALVNVVGGVNPEIGAFSTTLGQLGGALGKTGIMGDEMSKKLIAGGKAVSYYGDLMEPLVGKVNPVLRVHQQAEQQLNATETAMKKAGVGWTDYGRETVKLTDEVRLTADALSQIVRLGNDVGQWASANSKAMKELQDAVDLNKKSLTDYTALQIASMVLGPSIHKSEQDIIKDKDTERESTLTLATAMEKLGLGNVMLSAQIEDMLRVKGELKDADRAAIDSMVEEELQARKRADAEKEVAESAKADADMIVSAHLKIPPSMAAVGIAEELMLQKLKQAAEEGPQAFQRLADGSKSSIDAMVANLRKNGMEIDQVFIDAQVAAAKMAADTQVEMLKLPPSFKALGDSAKLMSGQIDAALADSPAAFEAMAVAGKGQIDGLITKMKAAGEAIPYELTLASKAAKQFAADVNLDMMSLPPSMGAVQGAAVSMATQLEESGSEGSKSFLAMATVNEGAIKKVVADMTLLGLNVPPKLQAAIDAADKFKAAIKGVSDEADRSITPIMGMGTSAIQTATSWSSMGSAGAKMESNMQPLVGMWLTITSATDAQNASLTRQLELMGKLTDAQNAVLDKAKGWKDYLAQLVDGYNTGVESLGVYVEQLGSFRTSLSTLFAGAQGDARAAIQEMIDMINKLMATAGSTPASNAQGDYATRTLGQTFG
jgi:hypothetical protein